jgi:hypothetical protein
MPENGPSVKLTAPQANLLSGLHNTDHGSLCLRGRDLVTVRRLMDLGYATQDGGRWHSITAAGREAIERSWSRDW